eukprot:Selendium_serpulae@DN9387_c0_g1_i1.p1
MSHTKALHLILLILIPSHPSSYAVSSNEFFDVIQPIQGPPELVLSPYMDYVRFEEELLEMNQSEIPLLLFWRERSFGLPFFMVSNETATWRGETGPRSQLDCDRYCQLVAACDTSQFDIEERQCNLTVKQQHPDTGPGIDTGYTMTFEYSNPMYSALI